MKKCIWLILILALLGVSCARQIDRTARHARDERAAEILEAVRSADCAKIQSILNTHPEMARVKDSLGYTPLHWASLDGNVAVAKLLIDRGANVNARSASAYTPLHNAARGGHREIIKLLLSKGASIDARSRSGSTPLKVAISLGNREAADLLASCGAKI